MNRRTHAQRKFAQITPALAGSASYFGNTSLRPVVAVPATPPVSTRPLPPTSTRSNTEPTLLHMNVHQLLDLVSTHRLQPSIIKTKLQPVERVVEKEVKPIFDENTDPVFKKDRIEPKLKVHDIPSKKEKIKQPIVKLKKSDVKLAFLKSKLSQSTIRLFAGGGLKKKTSYKLRHGRVMMPFTRSKATEKMSLRSRNVRISLANTTPSKAPPFKKPKTPSSANSLNKEVGQVQPQEVSQETPTGRMLRSTDKKKKTFSLKRSAVHALKSHRDTKPSKIVKLNTTPMNISDYSSEDETPLKFIPRCIIETQNINEKVEGQNYECIKNNNEGSLEEVALASPVKIILEPITPSTENLDSEPAKESKSVKVVQDLVEQTSASAADITTDHKKVVEAVDTTTDHKEVLEQSSLNFIPTSVSTEESTKESPEQSHKSNPICSNETTSSLCSDSSISMTPQSSDTPSTGISNNEMNHDTTFEVKEPAAETNNASTSGKNVNVNTAETVPDESLGSSDWGSVVVPEGLSNNIPLLETDFVNMFVRYNEMTPLKLEESDFLAVGSSQSNEECVNERGGLNDSQDVSSTASKSPISMVKIESKYEIYEFNSETESEPPPILGFHTLRRNTNTAKTETPSYNASKPEDFVIQQKAVDVPGVGKQLHCKLVLRKDLNLKKSELSSASNPEVSKPSELENDRTFKKNDCKPESILSSDVTAAKEHDNTVSTGCSSAQSRTEAESVLPSTSSVLSSTPVLESTRYNSVIEFPQLHHVARSVEAPVFKPTEVDFQDPVTYIESILPIASQFGMCKIVPPKSKKFAQAQLHLPKDIKFTAHNQYLHRMYQRWGPATHELCAMKKYLAMHGITFDRPPLIDGIEMNLPALFRSVQDNGGLNHVMDKSKWDDIATELNLVNLGRKSWTVLDRFYVKYLLPYDTMSQRDRQEAFSAVEQEWTRKYKKMVARAQSPIHRQRRILRGSESSESSEDTDRALFESEECVTRGRSMNLSYFKQVAAAITQVYGGGEGKLTPDEVEAEYWRHVLLRTTHVCVYAGAVDSGEKGLGFAKPGRKEPPWNLKVLSENKKSVIRSLGPVLGLTVPTIHLGMLYSTCCWNRDPHGLPWIEYHHTGAPKIWYGIPDEQSENFKNAVKKLAPTFCLNKNIWLPSDVTMLSAALLTENGVSLSRTVQQPGEIVLVVPKAYTSSICTGYSVSESVYFGPSDWLNSAWQEFHEAQESCEPTMFSLEQLLLSIAVDPRALPNTQMQAYCLLKKVLDEELPLRKTLLDVYRVELEQEESEDKKKNKRRPRNELVECDVCRKSLFISKVSGLTGKDGQVCCKHAVEILEQRNTRHIVPQYEITLHCRQTDAELENSLRQLEARLFPN